jgi:uncharacterized membrane-anchored protein YitT (DUF2179 family)
MRFKGLNLPTPVKRFGSATYGIFLLSLALNLVAWHFGLVTSGIPGIALASSYISGWPPGLLLALINGALFVLDMILFRTRPQLRTLYGCVALCVFLDVGRWMLGLEQKPVPDPLYASLYMAGLAFVSAIFAGIVTASGYRTGTYSALVTLVQHYWKIPPAYLSLVVDALLAIAVLIVFGWTVALPLVVYSLIFNLSLKYMVPTYRELV